MKDEEQNTKTDSPSPLSDSSAECVQGVGVSVKRPLGQVSRFGYRRVVCALRIQSEREIEAEEATLP